MKNSFDQWRYCREVSRLLPCRGRVKRQILHKIREDILHFQNDCPESGYDAIVARFGTPQQIASACVDEMDSRELLGKLNIKKEILCTVLACVAIMVALWAVGVGVAVVDFINETHGYFIINVDGG